MPKVAGWASSFRTLLVVGPPVFWFIWRSASMAHSKKQARLHAAMCPVVAGEQLITQVADLKLLVRRLCILLYAWLASLIGRYRNQ
jgi:hypothetical protein